MKARIHPALVALIIPLAAVVVGGLIVAFGGRGGAEAETFSYERYIKAPVQLSGNEYSIKAEIDLLLANVQGGRVVSVKCLDGGFGDKIAVFVPDGIGGAIYTGQRYDMKVKVGPKGGIDVLEMKKF